MKVIDIRKMSDAELSEKLAGYRDEAFKLRWQTASHQNQNPKRMRELRKSVARVVTIQNERNRKEAK